MSSQNQPNMDSKGGDLPEQRPTTLSRRKFLLNATAASVPVIAAVKSGSAWGCVDLQCSPGKQTLSTGGSAVASAVQSKANTGYLVNRPNWSSLGTIDAVLSEDYFKYLLGHYNDTSSFYYLKDGTTNTFLRLSKSTLTLSSWISRASSTAYTYNSSTRKYSKVKRYSMDGNRSTAKLIIPGTYLINGVTTIITANTSFSSIFNGVGSTFSGYKSSAYPYILAAFIGALWERHPEYKFQFPNRPLCYPEPADIVNRFNRANAQEKAGMENLFEFYTTGKVDGRVVR